MASFRLLLSLLLAATVCAVVSTPAGAAPDPGWSPTTDAIWDVTNADPGVRHTGPIRSLVWDLEEHNGRMYVAGRFLDVKAPDGTTRDQSYLAAFDLDTGVWIDSFRPVVDGTVYAIDITDDGRILAGGELTGGVAAYDVVTGARDASFDPGVTNSWGPPAVFDVEIVGNQAYIGGTFTRAQGETLRDLARIDVDSGAIDTSWLPTTDFDDVTPVGGGRNVYGIAVDTARNRIYVAGKFGGINGNDQAAYFATLDPADGSLRTDVPQGLPPRILSHRDGWSMWMHDVQFDDDKVYVGGQGHQTMVLDAATLQAEQTFFTNRGVGDTWAGGDTQVIYVGEDTVWSGCHCWGSVGEFELGAYISDPDGVMVLADYRLWVSDFASTDPFGQQKVNGAFGIDKATGELVPLTFDVRGLAGAYAIYEDSNGRVWFGGQYDREPTTGRVVEGLLRYSPADPDEGPSGLRSTLQTRERAVLNWAQFPGASSYEVLRDGEVVGTPGGVWFTDLGLTPGTSYDYSVRAVLADGTRSPASGSIAVTTEGAPAPGGLRSTLQTRERIVLNWAPITGAPAYEILRNGDVVGTTGGVWFTDRELSADTSYTYTVRVVWADGSTSPESDSLSVSTLP